jgi:hypothetical protein
LWVIWDKEKRGWHDKIANTKVVYVDKNPKVVQGILVFAGLMIFEVVIIGWAFFTFAGSFMDKHKGDLTGQGVIEEDRENILTFAPTSCGVSVAVPKTTDVLEGKNRGWMYEEVSMAAEDFFILDTDVFPRKMTTGAFIQYKEKDLRLIGERGGRFNFFYPGFVIFCLDNTKSLSLDEFKSLVIASKNNKIVFANKGLIEKTGNIEFVAIIVTEKQDNGEEVNSYGFIGVSKDGGRLFWIRRFANPQDSMADQLNDDIDMMWRNLQYREGQGSGEVVNRVNSQSKVNVEINQ